MLAGYHSHGWRPACATVCARASWARYEGSGVLLLSFMQPRIIDHFSFQSLQSCSMAPIRVNCLFSQFIAWSHWAMVIQFLASPIWVASGPPNDSSVLGSSGSSQEQSICQKLVVFEVSCPALDGVEFVRPVVWRVPRCLNQCAFRYSQHFFGAR